MSDALSFQEKVRFRLRGLEHRNLPTAVRKAVVQMLPDPFEGRSSRLPEGREIVFLHVPKTGGTSLAESLGLRPGHVPATRFAARDLERFQQAFKFAFVRDPVERLYSSFNYLRTAIGLNRSPDVRWAETYLAQYNDFETFVAALQDRTLRNRVMEWPHFRPMHVWLCKPNETVPLVDFLGRFETLADDMATLTNRLGISAELSHTRKPREYLDKQISPKMVDFVRDIYQKDVEIFGY